MKVVVAIDSFKGSMTSMQPGWPVRRHIGGNTESGRGGQTACRWRRGNCNRFGRGHECTYEHVDVTGPMGQKVHATYGVLEDDTAVMEMAEASGITLVEGKPDPWKATSLGVGEMILDAVHKAVGIS